jgi:hypothetical protein
MRWKKNGKWRYTPKEIERMREEMRPDVFYKIMREADISFEQLQEFKVAALDFETEERIKEGFKSPTTGWTYSYDFIAQQNFNLIVAAIQARTDITAETTIPWKVKEFLEPQNHTPEQIIQIATRDALEHKLYWQQVFWEKRILAYACTTPEELDEIQLVDEEPEQ